MSTKTDSKRQLIIDKAAELFSVKGYREVTMSDIKDACEISRGGLYLYYSSVEEIFKDVVAFFDEDGADMNLADASAAELLLSFIKVQKKEILRKNNLNAATYEFAFSKKAEGDSSMAKKKFDTAVVVLEKILNKGNETGEFACDDPKSTAASMMYAFEGMKVVSASAGITEKKVDGELVYMMRQFMEVED